MKRFNLFILLFLSVTLFTGCDDDEATPFSITLTEADLPFTDNFQYTGELFDITSTPRPTPGENKLWDYSSQTITSKFSTVPFKAFSDVNVPDANLSTDNVLEFAISNDVRNAQSLYSISSSGLMELGYKFDSEFIIPVFGGAGTITYPAEYVLWTPARTITPAPITFGYQEEKESVNTISFIANYPAFGLNNTPGAEVDSLTRTIEVNGWGRMKLPGYNREFEVLMVTRTSVTKEYYTLGGAPAPAALLNGLGIVDGASRTTAQIVFYTPTYGTLAIFSYGADGSLGRATFRNDIPE